MSIWDKVAEWFTKEESDASLKDKQVKEKELIDKLKEYSNTSQQREKERYEEGKKKLDTDKPVFDYIEVNPKSDEEISKEIESKYSEEYEPNKKHLEDKYSSSLSEAQLKKESTINKAQQDKSEIDREKSADEKSALNSAIRNGIVESSIIGGVKGEIDEESRRQTEELLSKVGKTIEGIDNKIGNLEKEKDYALENYDKQYAQKIESEISKLKKQRDKEVESANKYNNSLSKAEANYELKKAAAYEKYDKDYQNYLDSRDSKEARYGYSGERKKDYDNRLKIAKEFYEGLPASKAIELISKNSELRDLLGYNYQSLVRYFKEK